MATDTLHYTCVALAGVNKPGAFEKDEHGYYKVLLGALNIYNFGGVFYLYEESKHVFEKSSAFMRRVANGNLHGEEDHPPFEPGMTEADWIERNEWIETKNVCMHIRDVWTVNTDEMCNGLPVVEIWGWIKPDRERGQYLQAALDNPHQNVCFSLRAIVLEGWMNGQLVRKIDKLCTFDWVIEDGLQVCNKWSAVKRGSTVAQESTRTYGDVKMSPKVLKDLAERKTARGGRLVATESHRAAVSELATNYLKRVDTTPKAVRSGISAGGWR